MATNRIKKYTDKELDSLKDKFESKKYSENWLKKHFIQLIAYTKWVNGTPGGWNK